MMDATTTTMTPAAQIDLRRWITASLAALPWLNFFAPGPSSTVVPWLVSCGCGAGLWVASTCAGARLRPWLVGIAVLLVAWPVMAHGPSTYEALAWAGALLLIVLAASVADIAVLAEGVRAGTLAAAAISAVIGLLQYAGLSDALAPWVSHADPGEAYGNLRQLNQFATLCAIGMVLVLWPTAGLTRPVRWGLMALLALGSAASVSRTGLVQGGVLIVLAVLWPGERRRERVQLALVGACAYAAGSFLLPTVVEFLSGSMPSRTLWARLSTSTGCQSRVILWGNVLHLISLRPWTGWGIGELDYAHFSTLYGGPRFCDILDNAHNLPLQLAVELGVPAALLLCVGGLAWVIHQRPWSERDAVRQLAWALMAVLGVHSLLEYPLWYGPFQITCGLALGLLTRRAVQQRTSIPRPRAAVAVGLASFVVLGYAAWDYARVSQIYLPPQRRAVAWRDDPLQHAQRSWLFAGQARFAALTLTTPSRANAADMLPESMALLHYSPEPRVIERAIESASYLGRTGEAAELLARYRAAFPAESAAWSRRNRQPAQD
jgi:O-antigen ligase